MTMYKPVPVPSLSHNARTNPSSARTSGTTKSLRVFWRCSRSPAGSIATLTWAAYGMIRTLERSISRSALNPPPHFCGVAICSAERGSPTIEPLVEHAHAVQDRARECRSDLRHLDPALDRMDRRARGLVPETSASAPASPWV